MWDLNLCYVFQICSCKLSGIRVRSIECRIESLPTVSIWYICVKITLSLILPVPGRCLQHADWPHSWGPASDLQLGNRLPLVVAKLLCSCFKFPIIFTSIWWQLNTKIQPKFSATTQPYDGHFATTKSSMLYPVTHLTKRWREGYVAERGKKPARTVLRTRQKTR